MLFQKNLSWKISPEKSLDFWSQKSVLRPALRLRNMLLKATFKRSFWVLVGVTSAVTNWWVTIRMARYIFMISKNMPSSQYYIIYSPPFGWSAPLYSPPKRCGQHQSKTGCVGSVLGKPPLIAGADTTICTRFISRSLHESRRQSLPTLTAHTEPLPFSELAKNLYWKRILPKLVVQIYLLIRWPINRSNRFSDFLRLDRLRR